MKMVDINKKFTSKVMEYIAQGYVINVSTMGGSQGEEGKVDLVKGDEFIRVWMNKEHMKNYLEDGVWSDNMLVIRVGKWIHSAETIDPWTTVWMRDLEIISEDMFFELKQGNWYIDDYNEAATILEKRKARRRTKGYYWESESPKDLTTPTTQEIASRFMKRSCGYQRVCQSDIMVRKYPKANTYQIHYRGHVYNMH